MFKRNEERWFSYGFGAGFTAALTLAAVAYGGVQLTKFIVKKVKEGCVKEGETPDTEPEVAEEIVRRAVNAHDEVVGFEFERNEAE